MAVASGILLGVFEGIGVLMNRMFSENTRAQLPPPRMYHQPSHRLFDHLCLFSSRCTSCFCYGFHTCPRMIDGLFSYCTVYNHLMHSAMLFSAHSMSSHSLVLFSMHRLPQENGPSPWRSLSESCTSIVELPNHAEAQALKIITES
jgi:hypothetical protein